MRFYLAMTMKIKILYFAQLAELAEKSEETKHVIDSSLCALYADLRKTYNFHQELTQLQVAVNHQLSAHDTELRDGDSVAFLPPMTGG
ncbi:MAG: MoaD/ThiS family protein [Puniceicoccaceae bacterium]|nr:molybdopterin synthase sulfur carrier subunit [Puniceicoccaceae bacterium]RCL35386.1 MAG: MoaD/ThiS family protein [Puniceicoccaceae bacterium]|tara:strand:- start:9214 stop:9477 length:264 start_codon:yes stop_codon:yes gene_type:complete